jgi:hypothetical protein
MGNQPHHVEGAFYVWTAAELRVELGADAEIFGTLYGVREEGNVEPARDPHGEFTGKNILAQTQPLMGVAAQFGLTPEQANERVLAALEKLRAARSRRPRPLLDDKIITANNGLMISALAKGHQVLELSEGRARPLGAPDRTDGPAVCPYLQAAIRAAEFLQRELYDPQRGVLYRSWREGRGAAEGFAEDYAYLIQGLLDLYEASFEVRWLQWARELQAAMDARYWDDARGGYFNSRAEDAAIVLRLKEDYDGAEPAPSSVAAGNLLRLAAIGHDEALRQRGWRTIEAFRAQWSGTPHAMPEMLCAVALALEPPRQVVLVGERGREDFQALAAVLAERLGPRRVLLAVTDETERRWFAAQSPWMAGMRAVEGRATAYVCENFACQAPVADAADLRRLLG